MLSHFGRSIRSFLRRCSPQSLETCLILPKAGIVYAYVPKAACTSITAWLLRHSGDCPEFAEQFLIAEQIGAPPPDAHATANNRFLAKRWPARVVREALRSDRYFKFTVVRHPLRRLVSAYLDKIVNALYAGKEVIALGQRARGATSWATMQIDEERSLTFREFVQTLAVSNSETVDVHFRAQHRLLRGLCFDLVGRFENLQHDFALVRQRLNIASPLPDRQNTSYSLSGNECVADWPAVRFRGVAAPTWPRFFDESLRQISCQLYEADLQRFGYHEA
jgi:hypothetical protein